MVGIFHGYVKQPDGKLARQNATKLWGWGQSWGAKLPRAVAYL